ncbi:hypothetical protein GCM10011391_27860 [Pullulanibacillus camelliae]|uniref:Uncharacterized protein n=1 Tax=Pullulanibacillus camelliae TaxID=1707096 RepID=A0A8J3DWY8_9BACL|nr:hypothetical protein [Pullulanibacillus camelliae]GGE47472.1 hypothetical protein GCM10011391_27860 [Pullulanibacillus camelliae]
MKEIMELAWKMARHGQQNFGGKVKDYLKMALKLAWRAVKEGYIKVSKSIKSAKTVLTIKMGSRNHKSWVAKIVGRHATYKFDREFVDDFSEDYPNRIYTLTDGLYDVCDGGQRRYIKIQNGSIKNVTEVEVLSAF